jgi:diguanylate cyclase (GGDEF)-like protein
MDDVADGPESPARHGLGWAGVATSARSVVAHLQVIAPVRLWLVTEVVGAQQVVLAAGGDGAAELPAGSVLPWLTSFDLHMAASHSPALAPRVRSVPAYAALATDRWSWVRGYSGAPLLGASGELFGAVSGLSDLEDDVALVQSARTVQLLASLLSTELTTRKLSAQLRRQLATAHTLAEVDDLTGLRNRRGWHTALTAEADRHVRYGEAAGIIAIDLDGLKHVNDSLGHAAGDELLRRTANVLTGASRPSDVLARLGGDEFALLALGTDPLELDQLVTRLHAGLDQAMIPASVAGASHDPGESFGATWTRADQAMYADKRRRRGHVGPSPAQQG